MFNAAYSQETATLGIFDATADWGLEPEFPPKQGVNKIPGRVEILETEREFVYDLYGNGDDIFHYSDEGFGVFTERTDSWSISARIQWIDPGKPTENWSKVGVMIRENLKQPISSCIYSSLRSGECQKGEMINTFYRNVTNADWGSSIFYNTNVMLEQPPDFIYLRVTRIAELNVFYSEWSFDGINWHFQDTHRLPMNNSVFYGLAISNHNDNQSLAHARISDVKIQPVTDCPLIIERQFPKYFFETGKPFEIQIVIENAFSTRQLQLHEFIPDQWSVTQASHGGNVDDTTITWNIVVPHGKTLISYQVQNENENIEQLNLNGKSNGLFVLGEKQISLLQHDMWGKSKILWRYWDHSDGLDRIWHRLLSVNANGIVITNKNTHDLARIDGYNVSMIPQTPVQYDTFIPPQRNYAFESAYGQIWSASFVFIPSKGFEYKALLQYKDGKWESYAIDELLPTTFYKLDIIAGATDQVYLRFHDRIVEWNKGNQSSRVVKYATASLPYSPEYFRLIHSQEKDGSRWLSNVDNLMKMKLPTPENGLSEAMFEEYHINPEWKLKNFFLPVGNSELGIGFNVMVGDKPGYHVVHWKDNTIRDYFRKDNGFGFVDKDGTLWVIDFLEHTFRQIDKNGNETYIQDPFFSSITSDIALDPVSGIWIATQKGVAKGSSPLWNTPPSITKFEYPIESILEDRCGRIWFSSTHKFLRLNPYDQWDIFNYPDTYAKMPFHSQLCMIGDNLLALQYMQDTNYLLYLPLYYPCFDIEKERLIRYKSLYGDLFSLYKNPKTGIIWKTYLQNRDQKFLLIKDDGQKETLVGECELPLLPFFYVVYEDENGDVWVSLPNEMRLYHGDKYRSFTKNDGYTLYTTNSVIDVGNGVKWFGGTGFLAYDGQSWTTVKPGLGEVYQFMKSSDDDFWIASESGLWKFKDDHWLQYGVDEGLPSDVVYCVYEDSHKRIWAGTALGLSVYNPEIDQDPPITIIHEDEYIRNIPYGAQFSIGFTGKDRWKYTETERLLYSIRLDNGNWTPFTSQTVFSATGLESGKHHVEVRAMDRNANIDSTPASFEFFVLLPWYKELLFLLIFSISVIIILFLVKLAIKNRTQILSSNKQLMSTNDQLNTINAELQEANAQLLQLDQMKSAFVSQASHDLRTPLTAIKSSLDNVIRGVGGGLNEKQNDVIGRALKSVDRLTNLINDILDVNRIESGREVLHKEYLLFDVLVKNSILENLPAAGQKNISISTTGLDQSYRLLIDPGKIERVVGELIGNAIKYTPDGGRVEISLSKDNQSVFLTVEDSGIGMTKEECKKIWERFYRTDASKTFAKGSGLGLSIAKELVELHGGTIHVVSQFHSGSTFIVTLPFNERSK